MTGGQGARVCATCAYYRPARPGADVGECGLKLRGQYVLKGEGPARITISNARRERCSGHEPLGPLGPRAA